MSPEFLAILEERHQVGRWFFLLPICMGFLSLIISAVKYRKGIAIIYITLLAMVSVAIPTFLLVSWWMELSDVATTDEDTAWLLDHDGGTIIAPLTAAIMAAVFWIIAVLVLSIRSVTTLIRRTRKNTGLNREANESS